MLSQDLTPFLTPFFFFLYLLLVETAGTIKHCVPRIYLVKNNRGNLLCLLDRNFLMGDPFSSNARTDPVPRAPHQDSTR